MLKATAQNWMATRWAEHFRKALRVLGGVAATQGALACNDSDPVSVGTSQLIVLSVSPSAATVAVGDSIRLVATVVGAPETALARCSTSEPSVASVGLTPTGCTAVGESAGTAVITVTARSGVQAAAIVTVVK